MTGIAADLVQAAHVAKPFGPKQALRGLPFAVPPGQVCGLDVASTHLF